MNMIYNLSEYIVSLAIVKYSSTTKTLIDNILTSNFQNIRTYVLRTNISDLFLVLLSRQVNKKERATETKYFRQINNKTSLLSRPILLV